MKTILLVEDDADVAETVAEFLASCGLEVFRASTCRGGLESLVLEPDLILTDRQLPDDDGELLVLRRSKISKPDRPVIVMSGRYDSEILRDVLAKGADGFLPKPFDLAGLGSLLQKYLGNNPSPTPSPAVTAEEIFQFVEQAEMNFNETDWDRYEGLLADLNASLHEDAGVPREKVIPATTPLGRESLNIFERFKRLVEGQKQTDPPQASAVA